MILLVTPSQRAPDCAAALNAATGANVTLAENLARATTLLRSESYVAVVLDQYLLETEPDEAATTMEHCPAVVVPVNLALCGMDRLVREVCGTVKRRQREETAVRSAVISKFQRELNCTVTALLLSVELALESTGLPGAAAEKLRSVHELVKKLRRLLEGEDSDVEAGPAIG